MYHLCISDCCEFFAWQSDVYNDVTHRSSSSLGNFLLMTASSLFVNIWKGADDSISPGNPASIRAGAITLNHCPHSRMARAYKATRNGCNLISWDRAKVKSWKTQGGTKDKATGDWISCLLSKSAGKNFVLSSKELRFSAAYSHLSLCCLQFE